MRDVFAHFSSAARDADFEMYVWKKLVGTSHSLHGMWKHHLREVDGSLISLSIRCPAESSEVKSCSLKMEHKWKVQQQGLEQWLNSGRLPVSFSLSICTLWCGWGGGYCRGCDWWSMRMSCWETMSQPPRGVKSCSQKQPAMAAVSSTKPRTCRNNGDHALTHRKGRITLLKHFLLGYICVCECKKNM